MDNNFNMTFEESQDYISKRGFDIPWNDCDVFVDERDTKIDPTPFGRRQDLLEIYCPNCRKLISFENKPIRKELL